MDLKVIWSKDLSAQDEIYWHAGKRRGKVMSRQANISFLRNSDP
jgi:hypothetical protein